MPLPSPAGPSVALPEAPALVPGLDSALWLSADGEVEDLTLAEARRRLAGGVRPLLCHAPTTARRLGIESAPAFDLLELFAFVRPVTFCLPTPRGLAAALDLAEPKTPGEAGRTLFDVAAALLGELGEPLFAAAEGATAIARALAAAGWPWGRYVLDALGEKGATPPDRATADALAVWRQIREWDEYAPPPPAGNVPVEPDEARARLAALLAASGRSLGEDRPQQADYASAVTAAFRPLERKGEPSVVLGEAGTGVGKTLGYLAPAILWAEKNRGPVWISTFTKNLQRQLDLELDRQYPDPVRKARRVVVRKGRENYVCLLNVEEAVQRGAGQARSFIGLGLLARWIACSRDGDMIGGDFPAWLADLFGRGRTLELADRRGECIYSACPHYRRCFIEAGIRRARGAEIVVANHALVMIQAALGGGDDGRVPGRYVFDEGHHLFDAADAAFSGHLSGRETADLRRWLLGSEGGRRSRARGLRRRVEDLVAGGEDGEQALEDAATAARILPAEGWLQRLAGDAPKGPTEAFLARVHQQVHARARGADGAYSLETETAEPVSGLLDGATALAAALDRLDAPLKALIAFLATRLDEDAAELDPATRRRIEAVSASLTRRATVQIAAWRDMLTSLPGGPPAGFFDWFSIERTGGREVDVGMHRHWVDPMIPFAGTVLGPAHGVVITSASLRDGSGEVEADWAVAEARTGTRHLPSPAVRASVPSPFDYPRRTRVIVVTDVRKNSEEQVAAAYRELFRAAGGGALGLFTAIARLRAVHRQIAPRLEAEGMHLLAQHVDAFDTSTLIDIFRAETDSCLLGTDAVRDGVDVPGLSLRLTVFDRVPWPRPDLLHRARREAFGGRAYDDMIARLRLKQAFGRLVRRADDVGVFVLLDPMLPSRLAGAFPGGVEVRRVGLAEAVETTREFLSAEVHANSSRTATSAPKA